MIERRRPILSAIANRKMFMGGGMATSMPQPTYMDLMPQQMGIPREAQGIMASSQPLVDAIAADANNPAGGDTLSMAQGGVAKFDSGGTARFNRLLAQGTRLPDGSISIPLNPPNIFNTLGQPPASLEKGQIDTLTPNVVFEQGAGSVTRVPQNPIRMDFDTILNETDAERLERIFPEAAKNRFQATYEQLYPRDPDGPPRSYAGETARRFLSGVADFAGSQMEEVGQDISAIYNVLFTGEGREQFGDRDKDTIINEIGTARAVAELVQRRPDLNDRILSLSKTIIDNARRDGIELDGRKLKNTVAYGLSMESEINPNIGCAAAQADADRPAVDADPLPPEPLILGEGPDLDNPILSLEGLEDERALRPEGPFDVEGEIDPDDDSDVPRPKRKPPVPEDAPEQAAAATGDAVLSTGMDDTIMGGATPDAAAQVAKAFDKPMTKPEAKKTIEDYKRDFMKAMPEYEGVSEEEKGYRFIEAGLRVMAGQSPNAIENIANGLKGLGAEFAKDEKEKRAYERQVDLSASKYALEGIQRDEAAAQALAKEKRGLFNKIFVVRKGQSFEYNGKMYNEGDRIIPTVGSLQDGTFPIDAVSSEAFSLEQIKSDRAALKAQTDRLFKKVESPKNFVKSQTEYINASTQIKANIAISNLLKEAVVPLQAGKVTGGLNALRAFAQRVENFTGLKIPYADETPDAYRDKVGRAITANITSLLNEGNRTVSDADRTRAEEIGGLYANTLLAPTTKSANLLTEKLRAFEESIQRNNSKNIGIMSGIENAWNGTLNNQLQDYGDILRKSRGDLGSTARRATPGSRRTVRWTDIISVDPDNPSTLSFKPDWFRGK